jgi:hypothetical protein
VLLCIARHQEFQIILLKVLVLPFCLYTLKAPLSEFIMIFSVLSAYLRLFLLVMPF